METRTEYVEKLSAQIVEWDNQIELIKDKALSATPEAPHDYARSLEILRIKRDEAALKLQGITTAGDDEWEELKSGTERVWGEVRTLFRDAITRIS
jgi:hypothetical protein